jgi:two-component system, OmpR family, response regulator
MNKIAIVEDDAELTAVLSGWMEADGHSTSVYPNTQASQAAFLNASNDLVILDWELADACGLDVLRFVRQRAD